MGLSPVPPDWSSVLEALKANGDPISLNQVFGKFMSLMEDEFIGVHGFAEHQQVWFRGRGSGWKFKRP
eukprot:3653602-Pyramimonas_sp.AAC.1